MPKKKRHRRKEAEWDEAARRCRLSADEIRMAKELGIGPAGLIKNIPSANQQWKLPVRDWVRELYGKKFSRRKAPQSAGLEAERLASPAEAPARPPVSSINLGAAIELEQFINECQTSLDLHLRRGQPFFEREMEREDRLAESLGIGDPDDGFDEVNILLAMEREEQSPPDDDEIAAENERMQIRYFRFRLAAAYVARELAANPAVSRVALVGSVAGQLWKEIPRFRRFRRNRVEVWHECTDVDLAVWMSSLDDLKSVQRARGRALNLLLDAEQGGVAHHQVELFVFEPGSNRYLGRVCNFRQCPAEKRECLVEGCGASLFLRQHAGFVFDIEALTPERSVVLFDHPAGPPGSPVEDDEVPF